MTSPSLRPQQRLLVTGGRGRLAALIADHFRTPRFKVELYSRHGGDGFHPLNDLLEPSQATAGDVILHLAWSTLPATSQQHPGSEEQYDLPLLKRLLATLGQRPAGEQPHFMFFSSGGAVYGNAPGRPSREDDPCHPLGHYGRAKLAAEALITQGASQHGLPATILRISNPYGYPVPPGRAQGIISHAIRAAAEGRTLPLWGDGSARKDFIYYTDFLSALDEVIGRRLTGTYNLAAGESHSISDILSMVEHHTETKLSRHAGPAPDWDVKDSRIANDRLVAATGWAPQVAINEGIRRSAAGFLNH